MEYSGYKPRTFIDWAAVGSKLAGSVKAVQDYKRGVIEANDKLRDDAKRYISETAPETQSKSMNEMILGGADQSRSMILEWDKKLKAGEITPTEYRNRINNVQESWRSFADSAKSFDQRVTSAMERQKYGEDGTPPPASGFEMELTKNFIEAGDPEKKLLTIGDDGNMYIAPVEEPDKYQNVRALSNIDNIVDNRVDVPGSVQAVVKNWEKFNVQELLKRGSIQSIEDVRQNPAFKEAKYDLIESIVDEQNPRGVLSVLLDNSEAGYKLYRTDDEKNTMIADALKKEEAINGPFKSQEDAMLFAQKYADEMLIQYTRTASGNFEPVLSEEHFKAAKDIVGNQIEMQLGMKKEVTAGWKPESSSGGGSGSGSGDGYNSYATYAMIRHAVDTGDMSGLNAANTNYEFTLKPDGKIHVDKVVLTTVKGRTIRSTVPVGDIKELRNLSTYFWKAGVKGDTVYEKFDREKDNYDSASGDTGGGSGKKNKPKFN